MNRFMQRSSIPGQGLVPGGVKVSHVLVILFATVALFLLFGRTKKKDLPPDVQELGRSAWTLLHSIAATFPEKPSEMDKREMGDFINKIAKFYPCSKCSQHMQEQLKMERPNLQNRSTLQAYFCWLHNSVNKKLGKSLFDCNQIRDRWGGHGNGEHRYCKSL
jgi:hypothetical protein